MGTSRTKEVETIRNNNKAKKPAVWLLPLPSRDETSMNPAVAARTEERHWNSIIDAALQETYSTIRETSGQPSKHAATRTTRRAIHRHWHSNYNSAGGDECNNYGRGWKCTIYRFKAGTGRVQRCSLSRQSIQAAAAETDVVGIGCVAVNATMRSTRIYNSSCSSSSGESENLNFALQHHVHRH
jgi:hypothetical protein